MSNTISYKVRKPLFCPYYNIWGRVEYWISDPFKHNPFTVPASSTSGSPVIVDADGKFFGFMNDRVVNGAEFEFDGADALTIYVPEGQELYVDESGSPDAWRDYNRKVIDSLPLASEFQQFWGEIEYCTWVEQKALIQSGQTPHDIMNHELVVDYVKSINQLGYPKGKFTLDHGWQYNDSTYGDWDVHPERFPDMQRTVDLLLENGFTPGLWMAPVWFHPESRLAKANPDWLGGPIAPSTPDSPNHNPCWNYYKEDAPIVDYFTNLFGHFYEMGFRKFKFDMIYHNKEYMKSLHKMFYRAVKNVADEIEVEIHQPDIFYTPYCDAVRTNDVLCNDLYPWWRELTQAHIEVCEKSAPGKVINLDHIGGNDPHISGETFLEHLALYESAPGYPVVSVLPMRYGREVVDTLGAYLERYDRTRNVVSTYISEKTLLQTV